MTILTLNAGSSTLKFACFDEESLERELDGRIDWTASQDRATVEVRERDGARRSVPLRTPRYGHAVEQALEVLGELTEGAGASFAPRAVAHRVVHGGSRFRASVLIDPVIERELGALDDLAPLHNPHALQAVAAAREALPDAAQVAVFDTAFFTALPEVAVVYPLPWEWYAEHGVRRFGFHGISVQWSLERATRMLGRGGHRLIVCHAGSGASISALMDGAPVATSMGFTPLEGLMMGSRSGSVDPGILLHALRKQWLDVEGLEHTLNTRSGLLGVSGVSADYRAVERAAAAGVARAALALDLHARVLRAAIGSLVATLGGVDALVFTGGIGENSASMRARACAGLDCLGLSIDPDANATAAPDSDVARARGQGRILVVRSQEDAVLAREARRLLAGG